MSNNHKVGGLVEAIKTAVMQFGISPHSPLVVRMGDFGPEVQIEHVKVQGGLEPKIVLQVAVASGPLLL